MTSGKYAALVLNAETARLTTLTKALASRRENAATAEFGALLATYEPWARALGRINDHITVQKDDIAAAVEDYTSVGQLLLRKLEWPESAIQVLPQGSASTQTLIRAPDASKFDIDAVCQVDSRRLDITDPIGFFDKVGDALISLKPARKKRCWNIPCSGERHYLEFTPSIPLAYVSDSVRAAMAPRFMAAPEYSYTALAVVDCPTQRWKTSNPAGFTKWVGDAATRKLLAPDIVEFASLRKALAGVHSVPQQEVDLTDTLRVAIRLFKRHRDMCVRRNLLVKEFQPISIIIVTLLTACYLGLAELGRTYRHPLVLLADLAELVPGMVDMSGGQYRIDNPTVVGENFAECWNDDNGARSAAFETWCTSLVGDLRRILAAQGEQDIRRIADEIFGCTPDRVAPAALLGAGSGARAAAHRPPPPPPRTTGLA